MERDIGKIINTWGIEYKSWGSFKTALINRGVVLTLDQWELLDEILFSSAIHAPYSSGDIEYALRKIRKVKNWIKV